MTRTSNSLLMWAGNPIPLSTPSYHPLNPSHSFLILSYDFSSQIPDKTKQGKSESEYWNGLPFPSPRDLPKSGIKPRSPALQTGALLSEPPGKPWNRGKELLRPSSHCQHPRTLPSHLLSQMNSSWFCCASLLSNGLSRVFSNTAVQKHQFFSTQPSSQSNSHIHTWPLEKP